MKLVLAATVVLVARSAFADCGPFAVTTSEDSTTCTASKCGLRGAISLANACVGPTTITLPAGTFVSSKGALIASTPVRIVGVGSKATLLDGGGAVRVLELDGDQSTLAGVTLQNGNAGSGDGGGLWVGQAGASVTLQDVVVSSCSGKDGGGIASLGGLSATLLQVNNNTASGNGGGLAVKGGNTSLSRATLSANQAGQDGGGAYQNNGTVVLTNVTLSGNSAAGSGAGVAADQIIASEVWSGVTLADNQAQGQGGGLYAGAGAGLLVLSQTLIAGNGAVSSDADCFSSAPLAASGEGNNLVQVSSAGCRLPTNASDVLGVDPKIAPLADNGGAVQTHALLAGSPAIDAGGAAPALTIDARGVTRPQGIAADVGAFESGSTTLVVGGASVPSSVLAGTTAAHLYEVSNVGAVPALGVAVTAAGALSALGASQGNCTATVCTLGVIEVGGHATLSLLVGGDLQSNVQISGDNFAALATSVATTTLPASDLALTVVPSVSAIALTESASLLVTLVNRGPSDATNTVVTLAITGSGYLGSASSTACVVDAAGATCALGTLAAAGTATLSFSLSATALGQISYAASASSDIADAQPNDDSASGTLAVNGASASGEAPAASPAGGTQAAAAAKKSGCHATGDSAAWVIALFFLSLRQKNRGRSFFLPSLRQVE